MSSVTVWPGSFSNGAVNCGARCAEICHFDSWILSWAAKVLRSFEIQVFTRRSPS